jgi:hypothetical protein
MIEVKELIVSDLVSAGKGVAPHSPVRRVLEVYTKEGICLARHDNFGNFSSEDLYEFGIFCLANKDLSIDKIFERWKN